MAASSKDSASLAGKQRDRHLFENLPICILVADLTVTPAVIVEVNRRAALLYGYAAAELVGKPAEQLTSIFHFRLWKASCQRVMQQFIEKRTIIMG